MGQICQLLGILSRRQIIKKLHCQITYKISLELASRPFYVLKTIMVLPLSVGTFFATNYSFFSRLELHYSLIILVGFKFSTCTK
jgi:hypothetical protein